MEMNLDKTKIPSIALILMLTFSAAILALPIATAHDPAWSLPTVTLIASAPETVGVGQHVVIMFWLSEPMPTAGGAYGDRWIFYLEVTKPNGNTETLGPFRSDPVGGSYSMYTPDQVGTYYFQANFPGQTLTNENPDPINPSTSSFIGDYYQPSTSKKVAVTVQQDPIPGYQEAVIPGENEYWDRPINALNREWWQIASNWLMNGSPFNTIDSQPGGFQPYGRAPNSAHIVWKRALNFGGVVGGEFGNDQFYTGMSYEQKFETAIVIAGVLYFMKYETAVSHSPSEWDPPGVYAVDLTTGEELWYNPDIRINMGQLYAYDTGNEHGIKPYLWETAGSTFRAYDAFTGEWMYTIENVSGGTTVFGKDGSILRYRLTSDTLSLWNSSAIIDLLGGPTGTRAWQWRPKGKTVDGRDGMEWTVAIPTLSGQGIRWISDGIIVATSLDTNAYPYKFTHIGYSATTGQRLWIKEHSLDHDTPRYGPAMDGVYTVFDRDHLRFNGYDINNGQQIWTSEPLDSDWDLYQRNFVGAYGNIYSNGFGGRVYCINIKTGERVWTFYTGSSGYDAPYGHFPFLTDLTAADGKIFAINGEHSADTPLYKGYKLYAIDAYTGQGLWNISHNSGTYRPMVEADGYLVTSNIYDNSIYSFGKGESAVTVSGPESVQPLGTPVLIKGTVTDQSSGAKGTPAIADEYMTEWMEYLYMQQPCPAYVEGVKVKLETLDPNNNFYEIGIVTSDASGMYKLMWEPPVPGEYTIITTFEGSNSYYRSYAETAIGVTEAPSPGQPIEPEPTEPTEAPLVTTELVIILAAVIVAIAVLAGFWIIQKRK
jgi:hypothetical protein